MRLETKGFNLHYKRQAEVVIIKTLFLKDFFKSNYWNV